MKVKGVEISDAQVAEAMSKVDQVNGFTAKELEEALAGAGVPNGQISMRAADRVLQRGKAAKTLAYVDRKWALSV